MTNTQRHLLKLIKEIDVICKKNNIVYYLAGGSALGAVRHHGYIPWDDDADILMTRDNYYKFIEVCKTQLPENRCFKCPELDREYHNNFARYIDTTTTAIHTNQIIHNDPAGFVIDILVLDPIPDDPRLQMEYIKNLELYADLINPSSRYSFRWRVNSLSYFKYRRKIRKYGKDVALSELEEKMFSYKDEDCNKYILRWGGVPLISNKELYGIGRECPFEDTIVTIPQKAENYLSWHYGDNWMFLPPHAERTTHNAVYCFDTPYTIVKEEAYQYYDIDETRKKFLNRKIFLFLGMWPWHILKDIKTKWRQRTYSKKFTKQLQNKEDKIATNISKKEYGNLMNIFGGYLNTQSSRKTIGREDYLGIDRFRHPIYISIPNEFFVIAIKLLIAIGDTSKALRFLEIKEYNKRLQKEEVELRKYILNLQKATSLYNDKRYEESENIINSLLKQEVECISIIKLKILVLKKYECCETNKKEIEKYIKIGENLSKRILKKQKKLKKEEKVDGEFIKYKADMLICEDFDKALSLYLDAYNKSYNGIMKLEVQGVIKENYDYIIKKIEDLYEESNLKCIEYSNKLHSIFPSDDKICELWGRCQFLIKHSPKGIWNLIYELRKYIEKNDSHVLTSNRMRLILESMSGDQTFSKLYYDCIFSNQISRLNEIEEKIESLNSDVQWKMLLKSIIYYKQGKRAKSLKNSISLYSITNSSYIRYELCIMFRLELMMYSTFIMDETTDVQKSDIEKRNNFYINEFNCIYSNCMDTINMFKRLKVLPSDFNGDIYNDKNRFDKKFFEDTFKILNETKFSVTYMIKKIYGLNYIYDRNK